MKKKENKLFNGDWGSNIQGLVAAVAIIFAVILFFFNQEKLLALHSQQIVMNEQDIQDLRAQVNHDNSERDKNLNRLEDTLTAQQSKLNDRMEQLYAMMVREQARHG